MSPVPLLPLLATYTLLVAWSTRMSTGLSPTVTVRGDRAQPVVTAALQSEPLITDTVSLLALAV